MPRVIRPWILVRSALALLVVAAASLFAVAWNYSNDFLRPPRPSTLREQRVLEAGPDWVRISRDRESEQPGTWALEWPDGYGWIGDLRAQDDSSVVRDYRATRGTLPVGGWVSVRGVAKASDPGTLHGLTFESIEYPGPLGRYPAWLVPGGADTTWLIAVHGHGASRAEALRTVGTLAGRATFLVIGYRNDAGAPRSPDGFLHLGATEWQDLEAAVRYVRTRGARHIVVVGYSMGGQVVLQFLRHSAAAGDVDGAVLESPMLDWSSGLAHRARILGVPPVVVVPVRWVASWRAGVDWAALDQVRSPAPLRVPVLLFHGETDRFAPIAVSEAFARAHPRQVTFVRYGTGDHVEAWNVDPETYERTLATWLDVHRLLSAVPDPRDPRAPLIHPGPGGRP